MDGRHCSIFALALSLGLCGCVPGSHKTALLEAKPKPPEVETEDADGRSLNPFAEAPKREPKLELAMALLCERKAVALKDSPEQQFRQFDDARKMYQEILNYDPKNVEAFRGLARVYIGERDFARASATMKKAVDLYPKNAQLFADWSVIHSKQNDFAGAIEKLTKARELDPENQEYMKMLGVSLVCAGQVERGIDVLSRARGRAAAHYYVARLYRRTNQPAEARRHAELALEANPNFADARNLLADLDAGSRPAPQPAPPRTQFVNDE